MIERQAVRPRSNRGWPLTILTCADSPDRTSIALRPFQSFARAPLLASGHECSPTARALATRIKTCLFGSASFSLTMKSFRARATISLSRCIVKVFLETVYSPRGKPRRCLYLSKSVIITTSIRRSSLAARKLNAPHVGHPNIE